MASPRRARSGRRRQRPPDTVRYTIDASVFVNAFNRHEEGSAASLAILADIQARGDPVVVPALLLPEIASAMARTTDDTPGALAYAAAAAALPHFTFVTLTPGVARQATELAATRRLRGADAVYLAVARRYGTALVSRDDEQRTRGATIVRCWTPEEALEDRQVPPPD